MQQNQKRVNLRGQQQFGINRSKYIFRVKSIFNKNNSSKQKLKINICCSAQDYCDKITVVNLERESVEMEEEKSVFCSFLD